MQQHLLADIPAVLGNGPEFRLWGHETAGRIGESEFAQHGESQLPKAVRVVPEDLHVSASTVDAHGDELWFRHGSADSRVEAAQAGVPAQAATALTGALTKWQADTTALFSRFVELSEALRTAAVDYTQTDAHNAARIAVVGDQVTMDDLGL